jgi:hypothetical protein
VTSQNQGLTERGSGGELASEWMVFRHLTAQEG